jgi:hypothetical protein
MKRKAIAKICFCLTLLLILPACGAKTDDSAIFVASTHTEEFVYTSDDELKSIVILPAEVGTE